MHLAARSASSPRGAPRPRHTDLRLSSSSAGTRPKKVEDQSSASLAKVLRVCPVAAKSSARVAVRPVAAKSAAEERYYSKAAHGRVAPSQHHHPSPRGESQLFVGATRTLECEQRREESVYAMSYTHREKHVLVRPILGVLGQLVVLVRVFAAHAHASSRQLA